MPLLRPLRYAHYWVWFGLAMTLIVVYLTLEAPSGRIGRIPQLDKAYHFGAFLGLTLWFAALVERRGYWVVAIALFLLGVAIEIGQYLMALGRSAELLDVVADTVGIVLGIVLSLLIRDSWLQRVERWLRPS
ncbi:MAG: VanZ family protein [Gammaproteobacteria bacterium]|jgi:VanZ family protein|nr:VanZ family protein [Gammaproteobacteria bacterium]